MSNVIDFQKFKESRNQEIEDLHYEQWLDDHCPEFKEFEVTFNCEEWETP